MSNDLPAFLRAPRIPSACPVNITCIRTINDPSGNSRRLWIVRDARGDIVETIAGTDGDEQIVNARWPWTHSSYIRRFFPDDDRAGYARNVYPLNIDVTPGEYRRLCKLEPWSETAAKLRAIGDRCQRYNAICEAINTVRRDGNGAFDGEERRAVIYMRTRETGGDHVSLAVRRAMFKAERVGLIELTSDPDLKFGTSNVKTGDVFRQYRATDKTPYIG